MSGPDSGVPGDPGIARGRVDHRLAPLLVARLVGLYLLALAVLLVALTVVLAVLSGPVDVLVVVLVVGLVGLLLGAWWLRARAYVVRLDDVGYRVRLVRGAGVKAAAWTDVERVVAAHPRDIACLVLHLRGGGTTTVPVDAVSGDREAFARDVRERLQRTMR